MSAGQITLRNKAFSGTLKVSYSTFSGSTITRSERFVVDPVWRKAQAAEIIASTESLALAAEAFQLLSETTAEDQWRRAAAAAQYTLESSRLPDVPVYFARRETSGQVLSFPGTRIEHTNPNPVVSLRAADGLVRILVANQEGQSVWFIQNRVDIALAGDRQIEVEVDLTIAGIIWVAITTESGIWQAMLACEGNGVAARQQFSVRDFLHWSDRTYWNAASPSEVFSGDTGIAKQSRLNLRVNEQNPAIARFELAGNFDFAGCRLLGPFTTTPSPINYALSNAPLVLRLQDGEGWYWQTTLPTTSGQFTTAVFNWNSFTLSAFQTNSGTPAAPDTTRPIKTIELIASREPSTLSIYYVGDPPEALSSATRISEFAIVDRLNQPHALLIGDLLLVPAPTLPYSPVVQPDRLVVQNGEIIGWRGNPVTGMQYGLDSPPLQYFADAQDFYTANTNISGPFAPGLNWQGDLNFSWENRRYDLSWGGWQARTGAIAARYWWQFPNQDQALAQEIVIRWLSFLHRYWGKGDAIALTRFSLNTPPVGEQIDVAIVALYAQAALYANLAGGNRALSYQVLQKSLKYLLQYSDFSPLYQPNAAAGEATALVLETLALILLHKQAIAYPLPSDLEDNESDFAAKTVQVRQFPIPLNLPKEGRYGFRFTVPAVTAKYLTHASAEISIDAPLMGGKVATLHNTASITTDAPAVDGSSTVNASTASITTDAPAVDGSSTVSASTASITTDAPAIGGRATTPHITASMTTDAPMMGGTARTLHNTTSMTMDAPTVDGSSRLIANTASMTTDAPMMGGTARTLHNTTSMTTDAPTVDGRAYDWFFLIAGA